MITKNIQKLATARAKVVALEKALAGELNRELANLPAQFGFNSTAEFIAAVKSASGGRRGRPTKASAGKRRTRAVITDETRAEVKKQVLAKKTGSEIAKNLGISLPTVQNIKKALGLVKAKKG